MHSLDSIRHLTRGNPLFLGNLLTSANPTYDLLTAVCEVEDSRTLLISQILHRIGSQSSHLAFLIADEADDVTLITALLEEMIRAAGDWSTLNILCELAFDSPFMEAFRRADFNVWVKQRIWRFDPTSFHTFGENNPWRAWHSDDIKCIRALYKNLVPRLFHNLEPLTRRSMLGLVYYQDNGTLGGYADLVYGPKGIWALPVIHPEVADEPDVLHTLLAALPSPGRRPVYICVRSYQPWLEQAMQGMNAESSPEQVLMVKHLAIHQKVSNAFELRALDNGRANSGLPVAHIEQKETLPTSGIHHLM